MQHHVYFWLKQEHLCASGKSEFERALTRLSTIKHIKSSGWGAPADTQKRDVIDDSYSYAAYFSFETIQHHDLYQEDELHLEFVTQYKDWWEKVLIMDCQ